MYWTRENTGHSYNLRSAAENQDRNYKSDFNWYNDFTKGFNTITNNGLSTIQALQQARQIADAGRYEPAITAFQNKLQELSGINNWDIGSALKVKDDLFHIEDQVDLSKSMFPNLKSNMGIDLIAGFDHRTYLIHPDGNYYY